MTRPVNPQLVFPRGGDLQYGIKYVEALKKFPAVVGFNEQIFNYLSVATVSSQIARGVKAYAERATANPRLIRGTVYVGEPNESDGIAISSFNPRPYVDTGYTKIINPPVSVAGLSKHFNVNGSTPFIGNTQGFPFVQVSGSNTRLEYADTHNDLLLVAYFAVRVPKGGGFEFLVEDFRTASITFGSYLSIRDKSGKQAIGGSIFAQSISSDIANELGLEEVTDGMWFCRVELPVALDGTDRVLRMSIGRFGVDDMATAFLPENQYLSCEPDHPNHYLSRTLIATVNTQDHNDIRQIALRSVSATGFRLFHTQLQLGSLKNPQSPI